GIEAFRRCTSLTSVDIPNSVTEIGNNAFEECTSLTSVDIPNSITEIDKEAFQGCSSLTFVTIPNSVTKIGEKAFEYCYSLKEITLPESVSEIGFYAFDGAGLTELTVLNPIPPTVDNDYAFSNPENIALYVPEGSVDFYRLREPWSRFKSINAVDTAIEGVEVEADVAVSVCGAEIVAPEGSKIFDLKGRAMRATKLPAGVYIVRTPSGKTVKVTIAHP
ncbi:MAG: leucine-rich repeat domain-containing protein, partial [Bacteroides sp.]|nr:leucine-rich repeat domain-containing protein [Bacteroides sp.]